jgi:type II secretory pathway pseudopilin PulG
MKLLLQRSGASFIEVLLVIGIMVFVASFTIPSYRNYQIRSDLDLAANQTEQMINRAKFLSQSGEQASIWGIQAGSGILFKGTSFATRDLLYDEHYPFSPTITVSGLTEVTFSKLYGDPSATGVITLTALNGETREVIVRAGLSGEQTVIIPGEDVRMRIDFARIKNSGKGSAEAASYVGENAIRYEDGAWIPLLEDNVLQTDTGLIEEVTGFAVERKNGYVRILAHGDLENGGKEVVDAYISFEHATIENIVNDVAPNECENPFDGNINEGVGGDEVTSQGTNQVFFQTRTTNYGDGILIYWKQAPSRWF